MSNPTPITVELGKGKGREALLDGIAAGLNGHRVRAGTYRVTVERAGKPRTPNGTHGMAEATLSLANLSPSGGLPAAVGICLTAALTAQEAREAAAWLTRWADADDAARRG